jgi:signal transduction histidine kinase
VEDGSAVLCVQDDGRGFQMPTRLSELTHAGHFGLVGIAERAMLAGGEYTIAAQPGAGTTVTVRLPVSHLGDDDGGADSRAAGR